MVRGPRDQDLVGCMMWIKILPILSLFVMVILVNNIVWGNENNIRLIGKQWLKCYIQCTDMEINFCIFRSTSKQHRIGGLL